jgi:hypothetical protein
LDASADLYRVASDAGFYQDTEIARLSTSLKSMADLGVDGVLSGKAHQLFVDLGLPTNDPHAMSDIHDLLSALDPANTAKPIAFDAQGNQVGISLIISDAEAATIKAGHGFTETDLVHLSHLGVTDVVVGGSGDTSASKTLLEANLTTQAAQDAATSDLAAKSTVPGATPVLPDVKVIGQADPLHEILDPTKLHH